MISANFNIHRILNVRLEWHKYWTILEDLDLKLNYFRTNETKESNIVVKIGPFKPAIDGCKVYERRFFVKDGFMYGYGGNLQTKWALQVDGLGENTLFVNIHGKSRNIRSFLAPNLLAHTLLLPLLELKFFENDYLLLHSAAVSKNGRGYLIAGRGGAFKTSITMDLIRKYGFEYIGDERVLIGPNSILSFPTHIQIFEFLLNNLKNELMGTYDRICLIAYLLKNRQRRMEVADKSPLTGLLFLTPSTKPLNVKSMDEKTAAKKMVANMLIEYFEMSKIIGIDVSPVYECMMAYTSAYPDSKLAKFNEELFSRLEAVFSGLPIYEVSIPLKYDENVTRFVNAVLNREV